MENIIFSNMIKFTAKSFYKGTNFIIIYIQTNTGIIYCIYTDTY